MVYVPPPIVYNVEEARTSYETPFFYEFEGKIINLSAATKFYVDHLPFTSYYWPCARIGSSRYTLSDAMGSEEEAMDFLRDLVEKIAHANVK